MFPASMALMEHGGVHHWVPVHHDYHGTPDAHQCSNCKTIVHGTNVPLDNGCSRSVDNRTHTRENF